MCIVPLVEVGAQTPVKQALPRAISAASVKAHVMRPQNVRGITMEEVDPSRETHPPLVAVRKTFKKLPQLDVGAFGEAIHAMVKDNCPGYVLELRKNGEPVYGKVWNWAQTPADGSDGWDNNTRMHVASVSKFLTAVGMVKALDKKGLSYDTKIASYLPAHWAKGANIDKITFAHLLTHQSGFDAGTGDDKYRTDYAFMKSKVAAGVSKYGEPTGYENMNFGLCRILISIINGDISKYAVFNEEADENDKAWDAVTIYHFKEFMQENVFTPAGVSNISFAPKSGKRALAYPFPAGNKKGWDSGDCATISGGAGFRLSVKELLDVANHFRRKNTIVDRDKAKLILDSSFGIDQTFQTAAGKIYNKNGGWSGEGCKEQCVLYFFPNDIEVAIYVNSRLGPNNFSLREALTNAFINSLKD
jgi:CubicO group peptidase (beta-lactamase class C family)